MKTKMTMREQIAKFKEETGIGLEITDGKPYYNHNLNLIGTKITSLPDNLTVGGYLDLQKTSITSLPDNLTVGGSLNLQGTQISSLPDNLIVGGGLNLRGTQITSLPNNLTVGDWLDLEGTQITALPDNLTVGDWLDLEGTQIEDCNTSKVNRHAPISTRGGTTNISNATGYSLASSSTKGMYGKYRVSERKIQCISLRTGTESTLMARLSRQPSRI